MHSVFIVDDEIIVREGIREKIDWNTVPFSLVGEAGDGEIAFSMIQDIKPDILITDIKMPFMDGLELSRLIKKIQPWIRIIILSGHDEFEYAKQAISIGIEDYILKPFTSEELLAALNSIASKLDEDKKRLDDIQQLKKRLDSTLVLERERFLTRLVLGDINLEDTLQRSAELSIDVSGRFYSVCVCAIYSQAENFSYLYKIKSLLMDLSLSMENVIGFSFSLEKFVFILKSQTGEAAEDELYSLAEAVLHQATESALCLVHVAIGTTVDRLSSVSQSYTAAEHILAQNDVQPCRNAILNTSDTIRCTQAAEQSAVCRLALSGGDPLVSRLKNAQVSDLDSIINELVALLGNDVQQFPIMASYLVVDVIVAISTVISCAGGNIKEVFPEMLEQSYVTRAVSSRSTFISEMRRLIEVMISFCNTKKNSQCSDSVVKAQRYIADHFADPDICLHSVAEEIALSPNHFSAVFSQECGLTFIEYLTKVRIAQAKILLKTSKKRSADICYDVGFNDPHYFSFIFKKNTGLSPREYRTQG